MNVVIPLQLSSGLDSLPSGSDLDQDTVPVDSLGLVQGDDLLGLGDGSLLVVRQSGVDLGRNSTRNDLEDLLAEFDEQSVHGVGDLVIDGTSLLLGPFDGRVDELGVGGLVDGGEDQRGVGGSVLGLVDGDGYGRAGTSGGQLELIIS